MSDTLHFTINGKAFEATAGTTIAAAMLASGEPCRISVSGESRTALCGMGICFECRAVVNGTLHRRTCQMACEEGMHVETAR